MPTKLNQIVAVEKSRKSRAARAATEAYHQFQKETAFSGIARTYAPLIDGDVILPPEATPVQARVADVIDEITDELSSYFDVTAIKDWSNSEARADVSVGDRVILEDVPVTYLLFLEKQLTDIHTIISKLPQLNPGEVWHWDANANCFSTDPIVSMRTKKVLRNHVKAEATQHHPAQVETYGEDMAVGTWSTIKFSGALPAQTVASMLDRVDALRDAVKFAREQANETNVIEVEVGDTLLDYIFAPVQDLGN